MGPTELVRAAGRSFLEYPPSHPGWIALMILGFIFWWPVGLAILAYIIWRTQNVRMLRPLGRTRWKRCSTRWSGCARAWTAAAYGAPSSGNRAFDEYRSETLKRLEDEQNEFKDFLDRLRHAKDKAEFDQFMAERRSRPTPPTVDHTP
jgi:hypothetical protein